MEKIHPDRLMHERLVLHTPCRLASCILSTNINFLPYYYNKTEEVDLKDVRTRRHDQLNEPDRETYMKHPPSHAVDGKSDTAFVSIGGAVISFL